jgi:hypothetical protein
MTENLIMEILRFFFVDTQVKFSHCNTKSVDHEIMYLIFLIFYSPVLTHLLVFPPPPQFLILFFLSPLSQRISLHPNRPPHSLAPQVSCRLDHWILK